MESVTADCRPAYGAFVEELTLKTSHDLTINGLPAETQFHLMAVATDAGGRFDDSGDVPFVTGVAVPGAFDSDDFNACGIDTGRWLLVDPVGDATVEMIGAATEDARLRFTLPENSSHDPWQTNEAVRLMQSAMDDDFQVEFKLETPLSSRYQEAGVIIEEDSGHWMRFDFVHDGSQVRAFAAFNDGFPRVRISQVVATGISPTPLWMRVSRVGNTWTQEYSTDGVQWTTAGSFNHVMVVNSLGPYAGNFDPDGFAPGLVAEFDYFFETGSPLFPEDGGSVDSSTLTLLSSGNGIVNATPDKAEYNCGEEVLITATPAAGWVLAGWSGGLSGIVNPAPFTVAADSTITANFVLDNTAPIIQDLQVVTTETTATFTWWTNEPANTRVEYGETPTPTFWDIDVSPAMVTQHSRTLTSLIPNTQYYFRVGSTDQEGMTTFTANSSFFTGEQLDTAFASDDFNTCDPAASGPWSFINPRGDASFDVSGVGSPDVQLNIHVPGGVNHDPWSVNDAPRLMQPATDEDFRLHVKMNSIPALSTQQQGVIVQQDNDDWLRFDFINDGTNVKVFAARITAGVPSARVNTVVPQPIVDGGTLHMRLTRLGDLWRQEYSANGTVWTTAGTFVSTLNVSSIGVFGGNYHVTGAAPGFTASFDYFFETDNPVEPEDGGSPAIGRQLSLTNNGNGTVVQDPDQALYYCNIPVQLTAVPDPGSSFVGWSGDLVGLNPEQMLVMNLNRSVTATFQAAPGPPSISNVQVTASQGSATMTWTTNEPASSHVDLGPTAAYGQVMDDPTLVTHHSVTFVGLTPDTLYHYRIRSTDSDLLSAVTGDLTFTTQPGDFLSEDFQTCELEPGLWTFIDPLGDSTLSLVGGGTLDAQLVIDIPKNVAHDAWEMSDAPRVLQAAQDNDFQVEIKIETAMQLGNQMQGIWIEESPTHWLRFDFVSTASTIRVFAAQHIDGAPSQTIDISTPQLRDVVPLWMRVTRAGHVWTQEYSTDGTNWTTSGSFVHVMSVSYVGVFAGNAVKTPPHRAVFDYFFNTEAPVIPEDAGEPGPARTLDLSDVGNGTASVEPLLAVYYCDQEVELSALPQSGHEFTGWSGDLTGLSNPATVAIDTNKTIVGSFQAAPGPPVISDVLVVPRDEFATISWTTNEPTTSRVDFGETAGYGAFEHELTAKIHHELVITGLTPETAYHFSVTSVDSSAFPDSTPDATFVTTPPDYKSDDFNEVHLDLGRWEWVDPLGDSAYSIDGAGTGESILSIHVPKGSPSHDPWVTYDAPRLMQPANNTDFEIEVKIDSVFDGSNLQQGILIEETPTFWIRLDFVHNGNSLLAFAATHLDGVPTIQVIGKILDGPYSGPIWLRVNRTGDLWTHEYSLDGTLWELGGTFIEPIVVNKVGIFAGNAIENPAFIGRFDYFSNNEFPVSNEDQGTPAPDSQAPTIQAVTASSGENFFRVDWVTDEPTTGRIEYGFTPSYELGFLEDLDFEVIHQLQANGLPTDTTFHFHVIAEDAQGNVADSGDMTVRVQGVDFDIWYGPVQKFGHIGVHQVWANILGNVTDPDGIATLSYSLNGGPEVFLDPGEPYRRRAYLGDFIAEFDYTELQNGLNEVVFTATDSIDTFGQTTVFIDYDAGNVWPQNYSIDFSAETELLDVASVIDGHWTLTPEGVRTVAHGYDRLIGIGDVNWTDYEVQATVTLKGLFPVYDDGQSAGAALGIGLRWAGHIAVDESQPRWGFWPLGALAWYRWLPDDRDYFSILGNQSAAQQVDSSGREIEMDVPYYFKARVETLETGHSLYSFKAWKVADPETLGWDVQITLTPEQGPATGSLFLVAHQVDAIFDDVQVNSLAFCDGPERTLTANVVGNGQIEALPDSPVYTCEEDVTITALPDPGWEFVGWSGAKSGTVNPESISMTDDQSITATFTPAPGAPQISGISAVTGDTWATVSWLTNEPATSTLDFGETLAYELGTLERQTLTTRHSITMTGLTPSTQHNYRITVVDSDLNSVSSPNGIFTTTADTVGAFTSDDFNQCELDTNLWTFHNPFGDATYRLTGGGSGDAALSISVPGTVSHDPFTSLIAPRLMQPVQDTDFQIEVKFVSVLDQAGQEQGVIVEQDSNHWLRFDYLSFNGQIHAFAVWRDGNKSTIVGDQVIGVGDSRTPLYLRISRVGHDWTYERSFDGVTWVANGVFTAPLAVSSAGVFAGNAPIDGVVPDHTASFDYFFLPGDHVVPEDGGVVGPGYMLSVTKSGNGQVTKDLDQPLFHCQEQVQLTATPDEGWVFAGWSGDHSGVASPDSVTMSQDRTINGAFALDTGPALIGNIEVIPQHNWALVRWVTNELATSRIDYGTTASYGNFEESDTLTTTHSLVLTGLSPQTVYHYRLSNVDEELQASNTVDLTFTTTSFVPGPFLSDDFATCALQGAWTFIDPLLDSSHKVDGAGSDDAWLSVTVAGGASHNPWTTLDAPRLIQPIQDTDFQVEVRMESSVSDRFEEQGVVFELDSQNFLRFEIFANGTKVLAFASETVGGIPSPRLQKELGPVPSVVPMWLRVTRTGDVWVHEHSVDGMTWQFNGSFVSSLPVAYVGLYAANVAAGGPAPEHTAVFDYMFDTMLPIVPEDDEMAGPGNSLTVNVVGSGNVTRYRDQDVFYCDENVELTATPDPGWVFTGWTGDLSGIANPQMLAMDTDRTVTVTFDPNTTPPVIDQISVEVQDTTAIVRWVTNEGATSRVDYGLTTGYGLFVEDLTIRTSHEVTLAGLMPDETYHFSITSEDSSQLFTSTPDDTFATTPLIDRPFESDDFDVAVLDSRIWTFVDPLGDASFAVNGAGTENALLSIVVPGGPSHDPWSVNNAPRLMQTAQDEDFQAEIKFESSMNNRFQEQGIIVEADTDNWLRIEFHSDGAQVKAFSSATIDGVPSVKVNKSIQPVPATAPMWMRVTRSGNTFTQEYSLDGENWTVAGSFEQALAVTQVGVFAGNFNPAGDAPSHTAVIDYFFETSLPIVPEDTPPAP